MRRKLLAAVASVAAIVLLATAVLSVQAGPAAGETAEGDGVRWFVQMHTTLWGKIAALAHYDVVKTSEPLMCSDGAATHVCILAKTDAAPIVDVLRMYGVEVNVTEVNAAWVLVAAYNFTTGEVQWRNVTVAKAWRLQSGNDTVVVYQTPQLKKSLGEMLRIKEEVSRRLFALEGVTSVGVAGDKIVVTVANGTDGKPDKDAVDRVRKVVKSVDPEVEVEVAYAVPTTLQFPVPNRNQ